MRVDLRSALTSTADGVRRGGGKLSFLRGHRHQPERSGTCWAADVMALAFFGFSDPSQLSTTPALESGQSIHPGAERRGPMRPARLTPVRSRLDGWTLTVTFRAADAAGLALMALVGAAVAGGGLGLPAITPYAIAAAALLGSLSLFSTYRFSRGERITRHLARVGTAGFIGALVAMLLFQATAMSVQEARIVRWLGACFVGLLAQHAIWWATVRYWRAAGRLTPNIVVVGATAAAERLIAGALRTGEAAVLGVFDDRAGRIPTSLAGVPLLGATEALLSHKIMPCVDRVVIAVPPKAQGRVRQLIERLSVLPNQIMLLLEDVAPGQRAALERIAEAPLAPVCGPPAHRPRAFVKRAEDLLIGSVALVLTLPVMAVIALAIKLDSPGPILFRQRRHGFNNEEILVLKFRSMRPETQTDGSVRQVAADDDRVTRIGRFIRRTSLDELPQLFNVLKGEMSLVGPRPHAVGMKTGETESAKLVAQYAHRHRMKPGMTGWAAIKGSRGPVDTPEAVRRRVAFDIEYIERQSLMLDLKIMALTIPCLLGDDEVVR
jgi:Undecaprenyl-phosphate glucose phosphotransferase